MDTGKERMNRCLLILVTIGLAMRLLLLGAAELWYDECFTSILANLPISRMIAATAGDTHPPLYYVFQWGWVRLAGDSEIALRLPSVLAGIAAIPVSWYTVQALGLDRRAAWITAAMVALSPAQIYFSQEARMYTMLQLALLLAVMGIAQRRWVLAGVSLAVVLWLHNYGLIYAAALGVYALARERRLSWPMVAAFGLAGLSWLPWASVLLGQMQIVSTGYWIEPVKVGDLIYTLTIMLFGIFSRQFIVLSILATVALVVWSIGRRQPRPLWWLAFGPMALAVVASLLWKPMYLFRGIVPSAPYLYALIAVPLARLDRRRVIYAATLLLPVLLAGWFGYVADIINIKSNTINYVDVVRQQWQPGDILYSTSDGSTITWLTYASDLPLYQMPEQGEHDRGALSPQTREAIGVQIMPLEDIEYTRAWVLFINGATTAAPNAAYAEGIVNGGQQIQYVADTDMVSSGIWLINHP